VNTKGGRKFLHGEKILFTGEGSQKNPKPKYFSFFASRLPHFAKERANQSPIFSRGGAAHWPLKREKAAAPSCFFGQNQKPPFINETRRPSPPPF
jgi:hypothetical protein